jgi:hypothetical protein
VTDQVDPLQDGAPTPLMQGAAVMHESFKAYVAAGFTEAQAIAIVTQLLIAAMKSQG